MQIKTFLKTKAPFEIVLGISFLCFLLFPRMIPHSIANFVESTLGIITLLSISVLFFVYAHLIVSILFIFVAYELIRRSSKTTRQLHELRYSPTQHTRDMEMQSLNTTVVSLEEEMVSRMTPLGSNEFIESTFKPVYDDDHHAFKIK